MSYSSDLSDAVEWVAVDWGTSHLRLWPMGTDGVPLTRIDSDRGMGTLTPDAYETTLLALLEPYISQEKTMTVLCCGMAGARQGWVEAPYSVAPCAPPAAQSATRVATEDSRLEVRILSGVSQSAPADVMRGEETQIAGVLAAYPDLDGVICLPGTHTKWVSVQAGQITSFATFMTGELFQLVSRQSVLRHSVAESGWDAAAFTAGCEVARVAPHAMANALFSLRAEALLADLDPVIARARLSGYLLGLEVEAARPRWQNKSVVIVGEAALAEVYALALSEQGQSAERAVAEDMTLAGLRAAYAEIAPKLSAKAIG